MTENQKKCLEQAESYMKKMPLSEAGLKDQLDYKGYDSEEINFALENINADWNENALHKAKDYVDTLPLSDDSLKKQLAYDGFTEEQVAYAFERVFEK